MDHNHAPMDHAASDHSAIGHDMAQHVLMYRRLFWTMLVLAVPTTLASAMFADLLGYPLPGWSWLPWVSPVLGTVMYVWGGRPFLTGAVDEIRARTPGMMLLIALGITVAFLASWGAMVGLLPQRMDFWWELALLIVIMLLGHWLEMASLTRTSSALDSLAALLPDEADRIAPDGAVRTVPVAELAVGDLVLVRPGARVPADGVVVEGVADLDESMVTGESRAVRRGEGDPVVAGTVTLDSAVRMRVSAVGEETSLAGIRRLVAEAQQSSSPAQLLADRVAGWLFWYALGVAVLTAVTWLLLGQGDAALAHAITVLVIACPHALGLAIPLVVSIATERAAAGGVLVKSRPALESMRTVNTVVFDKTGTLTRGEPAVVDLTAVDVTASDLLSLAASVEAPSEHPLARAIVAAALGRGVLITEVEGFASSPAMGVDGTVAGHRVQVGGPALLVACALDPLPASAGWQQAGSTVIHVVRDGRVIGAFALADEIRPESREAIAALHAQGFRTTMITGDAEPVARTVARELGIDDVLAQVRPGDKSARIEALQAAGRRVAMVGDGVNDAPALARADVGIAIGAGTDVAIATADVILVGDDPRSTLSVIDLSRATYRKMTQNLWWAAGYNLIAVPLAAGVLAPIGFTLPMSVGAILMSLSTVVVALNAQTLRRLDLSPEATIRRTRG
ncbi:copper-translocating P-type ATPase [Raineyella sp. W15-4]|uniref:copper-translocating P-type ATPase n=1 Tax=Raineyella sp. W15-4 TaxID=3081651 RepID=UPI0029556B8C|nr:copper-translocating P-type ATPase [Raineyella sp. W15-4]WOQ17214.1 copper-translocating P-type ATPase [Raineyella sp. W15-4]